MNAGVERPASTRAFTHSRSRSETLLHPNAHDGGEDVYPNQHRTKQESHHRIAPSRPKPQPQLQAQPQPQDGTHQHTLTLAFYPTYCYKASPTWFTWVKLTAHDIHHRLHERQEYQVSSGLNVAGHGLISNKNQIGGNGGGGNQPNHSARPSLLLFYLNHPIRFVQLVGIVVTFETYFDKFWLFTVDDSSGSTIEVTCRKPETNGSNLNNKNYNGIPNGMSVSTKSRPSAQNQNQKRVFMNSRNSAYRDKPHYTNDHDDDEEEEEEEGNQEQERNRNQAQAQTPNQAEDEDDQHRQTVLSTLQIGTPVQIKGTLTTFRSTRQLTLERIKLVQDTNHELSLISARTTFYTTTLSHPWVLTSRTMRRLKDEQGDENRREGDRARQRRENIRKTEDREKRHADRLMRRWVADEEKRRVGAERARAAGELLKK